MKNIKKRVIKSISPLVEKYLRHYLLVKSTNVKGKYTIQEDKIIFKMDDKSIHKLSENNSIIKLKIDPILLENLQRKWLKLDKKIIYVFENIHFDKALSVLNFSGETVYFKNCYFEEEIRLCYNGNFIFEDNTYHDKLGIYYHGQPCFLSAFGIHSLTFMNDCFTNSTKTYKYSNYPPKFGIKLEDEIDTLKIINSQIKIEGMGEIQAHVKNFIYESSSITAPNIYLEAKHIEEKNNSSLTATDGLIIENEENNPISNIKAPIIIYNGETLPSKDTYLSITKETTEITKNRRMLIETLQKIKNQTLNTIEEEKKKRLEQPVHKILKKIK